MPRRAVASATPNRASPNVSFRDDSILPLQDASYHDDIATLRRQWKWAAFSQFFYTFNQLLAMPDVTLTDVEDDLAHGTALYLPRIMQRLLYTLTQDRKINIDNWQTALRKQYLRRDPEANPLGTEPPAPSRKQSREPTTFSEIPTDHEPVAKEDESTPQTPLPNSIENAEASSRAVEGIATPEKKAEDEDEAVIDDAVKMENGVDAQIIPPPDEPKDWFELPLLTKLDTLHLLTEWQFQNPHRLRTIMKDDGDAAQWRHEPIGYDAKTNAYWLIGPDRLWIQRVPPKPPRQNRKRKAPPKKTPAKASTSKAAQPETESESEIEPSPSKRRRTSERTPARRTAANRATRTKAKEAASTPSGRGTRAAKLQANKKLDAQAKELAEYQRQAALLTSPSRSGGRTTRQTRSSLPNTQPSPTPTRRSLGTRTSARLRGTTVDDDDDEWQQIPEEWLNETADSETTGSRRAAKGKGKGRETRASKGKTRSRAKPAIVEEESDEDADAEEDVELKQLAERAGLESDGESSVLTELSDDPQDEAADEVEQAQETPQPQKAQPPTRKDKSKKVEQPKAEPEPEPEPEQKPSEDAQIPFPPGFVEWEAICVTLQEWEHVADQFEKATHYLEKALYKVLAQNIVPLVTEELRERERKRKMEEALVHRKRSSRIALKEIEKEEARAAAQKKAEEDEKMARVRRAEARAKKEEAEREKREKAREQRRLEREERERLKEQQEKEAAEVDIVNEERSKAPVPNGASSSRHHTVSRQTSRVVTPSGTRTDWILDCEICRKNGINLDDGQSMVCCNSCQRWQHIACHDMADRSAGRPPRDWRRQQFYCQRCRPSHTPVSNGNAHPQRHMEQYGWSQPHGQKAVPPAPQHAYPQQVSDARYSQFPTYENGTSYQQPYMHNRSVPQSSYPHPQGNITFSHYQPEQGGFSRTSQQAAMPGSTSWSGSGYPSHGVSPHPQQPPQMSAQYSQNGMFNGGRVAQSYQYQSSQQQRYNNHNVPDAMPAGMNGNWTNAPNDFYASAGGASQLSASQLNAAESLAYMQRSGRNGWPNGSAQHPQNNGYPPSAHLPSMTPHHYPPS